MVLRPAPVRWIVIPTNRSYLRRFSDCEFAQLVRMGTDTLVWGLAVGAGGANRGTDTVLAAVTAVLSLRPSMGVACSVGNPLALLPFSTLKRRGLTWSWRRKTGVQNVHGRRNADAALQVSQKGCQSPTRIVHIPFGALVVPVPTVSVIR